MNTYIIIHLLLYIMNPYIIIQILLYIMNPYIIIHILLYIMNPYIIIPNPRTLRIPEGGVDVKHDTTCNDTYMIRIVEYTYRDKYQ